MQRDGGLDFGVFEVELSDEAFGLVGGKPVVASGRPDEAEFFILERRLFDLGE